MSVSHYNISFFSYVLTPTPDSNWHAVDVISLIRNGNTTSKAVQKLLRESRDKKTRTEAKKQLPAVTWSGTFSKRNKNSLLSYSGLICLDLDHVENIEQVKQDIYGDLYIYTYFTSPSGDGLKLVFKTDATQNEHEMYFEKLVEYVVNEYGLVVDKSGRDVCRLCFLPHDPNIYVNESETFTKKDFLTPVTEVRPEAPKLPLQEPTVSTNDLLAKCDEITRKKEIPGPGNYNRYINNFSIFANRYGIHQQETIDHLIASFSEHNHEETRKTVQSAYSKFCTEHGLWIKTSDKKKSKANTKSKDSTESEYDETTLFWYEVENDKTGKVEYKFAYDDSIEFLHNNGFYRLPLDGDQYNFIHVNKKKKHVQVIQPIVIKDFFLKYLKSTSTEQMKAVREMFRRGAKNYCSIGILEGLDYFTPDFKKDTKTEAFVFFRNCFITVTKDEIIENDYTKLDKYIWAKQVIDFDYKKVDYGDSDFSRFLAFAVLGHKNDVKEWTELETKKYMSLMTTTGYLLHRYKNPSLTKAVVAADKRLRSSGENNGRTGKSLYSKAIGKMLNMVTIDGKNFSFDKPFPFQMVKLDTQLINFNDILKNFDFERLFGMITEEFFIEKKNKDAQVVAFEDSPKIYISTNMTLKGSGESTRGRQQIIEFDNYFNADHTPVKEFGRMFFYEWDATEYSKFYSFMVDCLQLHLEQGLIEFPVENYEVNKLIDMAGEEFMDYMEETVLEQLVHKCEYEPKLLHEAYINKNKAREKTQIKTFNKYVKMWADIKKLSINAHKGGGRDRRNGTDYITFTAATNNPEDSVNELEVDF